MYIALVNEDKLTGIARLIRGKTVAEIEEKLIKEFFWSHLNFTLVTCQSEESAQGKLVNGKFQFEYNSECDCPVNDCNCWSRS